MNRSRRFRQVDVFAARPWGGNPVAVVLDGDGLDDDGMARFARWTNLSETTFLLPPSDPSAHYRLRIFTPVSELPFAGHPTLGSCHAWLEDHAGFAGAAVVQECGAGLVRIRRAEDGRLLFAAPPTTRSGSVEPALVRRLAAEMGVDVVDARWVVNGPPWIGLLLGSAEAVLAARPPASGEHYVGLIGLRPGGDGEPEVRAFFPSAGGIAEDPVTGSLNASLAQWLLETERLTAPYVARQGTALDRDGRVGVVQDADGTVWVGGTTTTRVTGRAFF